MNTLVIYSAAFLIGTIHSYHIGNSLSRDGYGDRGAKRALEAIAFAQGHDLRIGYHFYSGGMLSQIWDEPNTFHDSRAPYGDFSQALPNYEFDHITLEPYGRNGSDFANDKRAIAGFIDLARQNPDNHDTTFYVYQLWSQLNYGHYGTYWDAPIEVTETTLTTTQRVYYDSLMNWADEVYKPQGIKVRQIPTGEVFYRLSLLADAGELPVPFTDLYRDKLHASLSLGRYVVSATMFSTMFQQDITEVMPLNFYFLPEILTPELATLINRTVWEVVSSDPHAGVFVPPVDPNGDMNHDGYVGSADLAVWLSGFGTDASGDADGDGDTDGRDLLIWQRQFLPLQGDLNANGHVDTEDLAIWHSGYGTDASGDVDGDGDTDGRDFLTLQRFLRPRGEVTELTTAGLAVPEPSGIGVLLAGLTAGAFCRRI